jgi:hypothetical protein
MIIREQRFLQTCNNHFDKFACNHALLHGWITSFRKYDYKNYDRRQLVDSSGYYACLQEQTRLKIREDTILKTSIVRTKCKQKR